MVMSAPVLRQDDLHRIGFGDLDPWEIDVQPDEGIIWSVLLAFLKCNIRKSEERLGKLMTCLGVTAENFNMDNMKRGLLAYNPFLNMHSCFYNANLKLLVNIFKNKIYSFTDEEGNRIHFRSLSSSDGRIPDSNETKLQAMSLILNCKVFVVCDDSQPDSNDPTVSVYPIHIRRRMRNGRITLYRKENAQITFKFGISIQSGDNLQETALGKILQSERLIADRYEVRRMVNYSNAKSNFLISLLENNKTPFIQKLYKQPPRVLEKISEAGFNLDPAKEVIRNGCSINAFIYVLVRYDIETLYLLYSYAPYDRCGSPRHPTGDVIVHLENLSQVLLKTKSVYEKNFKERSKGLIYIEELLRLHSFQFKVSEKIFKILNEQYHKYLYILKYDVDKRKRIVLAILDEYIDYFYMNENSNDTANSSSIIKHYANFFIYRNFFRKLDLMSALFFFDKIYSLKEHLRIDHDHYDKIESSFVRLAFINSKDIFDVKYLESRFNRFENNRFEKTIEHLSRVEFEKDLETFRDLLKPIDMTTADISNRLPEADVYTLTTELDIRDHMFIHRLEQHMTSATNSTDFEIGVLIIQRALQVLGESVHIGKNDTLSLAKSLVASCFSMNVTKTISELRDLLSDYPVNQTFSIRQKFEKEENLFADIQEELRKLNDKLKPIYRIQSLRIQKYLCLKKLEMFKKFQRGLRKINTQRQNLVFDMLRSDAIDFFSLSKLSNELQTLNSKKKELRLQKKILLSSMRNITKDFTKLLRQCAKDLDDYLERNILWIQTEMKVRRKKEEEKEKEKGEGKKRKKKEKEREKEKEKGQEKEKKKEIEKEELQSIKQRFKCIELIFKFLLNELCSKKILKTEMLTRIQVDYDALTMSDDLTSEISSILNNYKGVKTEIFQIIKFQEIANPIDEDDFSKNPINAFSRTLKGFSFLSDSDKKQIKSNIPKSFVDDSDVLDKISNVLQVEPSRDVSELISRLSLPPRKRTEITDICENHRVELLKNFVDQNDHYKSFLTCLAKNSFAKAQIEDYCKRFGFSQNVKQTLEDIKDGKAKIKEDKALEFLSDRIHKLHRFLIQSDAHILHLYKTAKGIETKQFMGDLIVRQFMRQPNLQAAVEFILCDCMILLKTKTDLRHLWIKMNDLFYGITLRNVLAHGNPLFEAVIQFFDPGDLPNEIINKAMELLEDMECIDGLCELRNITNFSFEDLVELIDSNSDERYAKIITKIKQCSKWEDYVALVLPGRKRPGDIA